MSSETQNAPDESLDLSLLSSGQKKKRQGPYRGPSRALKYKKLRLTQPERIKVCIPEEWGAVVGGMAKQFVAECREWVKETCPLNVQKWEDMPEDVIDRLYGKIKAKYELPEGAHVMRALKKQCSSLYRMWRERLKKKHFTNNTSLMDVERSCPSDINPDQWKWLVYNYWSCPKQRERSEKNRANALSVKIRSATGSKSIARVVHEIDSEMETPEATQVSSSKSTAQAQLTEPIYIQLWIKTKSHNNGKLDEEAERILAKLRELHSKVMEEKGSDELTIEEAYEMILGHSSGHARGLGKGHTVPSKKVDYGKLECQFKEREKELRAEIEKKEIEARERQEELMAEMEKKENEAMEREKELRSEIEKKEKEAMEREAKIRDDLRAQMMQLFSQLGGATNSSVEKNLMESTTGVSGVAKSKRTLGKGKGKDVALKEVKGQCSKSNKKKSAHVQAEEAKSEKRVLNNKDKKEGKAYEPNQQKLTFQAGEVKSGKRTLRKRKEMDSAAALLLICEGKQNRA